MLTNKRPLHPPAMGRDLPSGWVWSRLDEVCLGIFDCPHSTPALAESGPHVVRTQDILSGVFRIEAAAHVSEETYRERIERVIPSGGDLLYSREGTYFGIAAEVPSNVRLCLGQRMVLLRPDHQVVTPRFLRYWLNSHVMALHIAGYHEGSVAQRLNLPTIRALPVLVPSLPEQQAIAEVLGALDDKIDANNALIVYLKSMSAMQFERFLALAMEECSIEIKPLGRLGSTRLVKTGPFGSLLHASDYAAAGVPLILVKHVSDGMFLREGLPLVNPDKAADLTEYSLKKDDIVITRVGRVGDAAMVHPDQSGWLFSGQMLRVRMPEDILEPYWLFGYMMTRDFHQQIDNVAVGSTRQSLSVQLLEEIRIPLAPSIQQKAFANVARPLWQCAEALSKENGQLQTIRDTLVRPLLSGKLRVRDAQSFVGDVV
jgi:type I restriction enzyme, S subunit